MLTCTPDCVKLWALDAVMTGSQAAAKLTFEGCYAAAFSPIDNQKVLGTSHGSSQRHRRFRDTTEARIFDVETGAKLLTLVDAAAQNPQPVGDNVVVVSIFDGLAAGDWK